MTKGLAEPYDLNQEDVDITQADTVANVWGDLFLFRAPIGRSLVLRPGDPFGAYLKDTAGAEALDTVRVKLEHRDATGAEKQPVTTEILYASIKEFQDEDLLFRLPITREIEVAEQEYLSLMAYSGVAISKDTSYFDLTTRSKRG